MSGPAPSAGAVERLSVPPPVELDRLRWWHLDDVLHLARELFGSTAWSAAQFWSELARVPESRWYLVAREAEIPGRPGPGERIVGYAGINVVGAEADIQTVAVAPDAQGRGIGSRLVQALADRARGQGVRLLHLEVRADNEPALVLYRRLGFEAVGRRRDYYGRGHDGILMTWRLGPAVVDG